MNVNKCKNIDYTMANGKKISDEDKKKPILIKSLPDTELIIDNDNGWTVSAHIKYNHHKINITYYRQLPECSDNSPVRIIKRCIVHNWYYLDSHNKMAAYGIERELSKEIIRIFDNMLDIE